MLDLKEFAYGSRCWENALGLASDDIARSVQNVSSHWFQKGVTVIAFLAA